MADVTNWQGQAGLAADCKLNGLVLLALQMRGEHPCDHCNMDRQECHGFPRKEDAWAFESDEENPDGTNDSA